MRVAVALARAPFVQEIAGLHAANLRRALRAAGHEAEIVSIPFQPGPPETIAPQMLACRLLDLTESMGTRIDRLIGLNFPAYLVVHPDKVPWVLQQVRSVYDLWDRREGGLYGAAGGAEVREAIRTADTRLIPQARAVFAGSRAVADRLHRCNGIAAVPLYPPPPLAGRYRSAPAGNYLLMLAGSGALERHGLVLDALARTRYPVRIVFAGDDGRFAGRVDDGTAWLGPVTEERRIALLSEAVAVLVPPLDAEDASAALEAMASARAVITCTDSGAPLEAVAHGRNGLVCEPGAAALADAMDQLWADWTQARTMGEDGRARYDALGLSWEHLVRCLLG